jgi:hypothetical protein
VNQELRALLLGSIEARRLVAICGAGLSMAPPSSLPSAANLARQCASKYEALTGSPVDEPTRSDLEAFARLLHGRNQLRPLLIGQYVGWEDFRARPNEGHCAVADLLLCRGIYAAVSTNYDTHVEHAAWSFGERDFTSCLDGDEVQDSVNHSPFIKVHGCCVKGRANTVWLPEQLEEREIQERLQRTANWARAMLRRKDFLVLGFWSDWPYLTDVLDSVLRGVEHNDGMVVVVDPAPSAVLREKAPFLWDWASAHPTFHHVKENAEVFLRDLQTDVSHSFLRRAWNASATTYEALSGAPAGALPDPAMFAPSSLYQVRRDFTAAGGSGPVRTLSIDNCESVAAVHRRLLDLGAAPEGPNLRLAHETYRVVSAPSWLMSRVQEAYGGGVEPQPLADKMICVGALDDATPANVVRADRQSSVLRPQPAGEWLTVGNVTGLLRGAA